MVKLLKIILVDDHALFRNGLKLLIETKKIGVVVAEAENGMQFLSHLESIKPDCVLMDIEMPIMDGILATRKALEIYPDIKILGLSMFVDEQYYGRMLNAGAKGFLLKKSGYTELIKGITEVVKGESYISAELLRSMIVNKYQGHNKLNEKEISDDITDREFEILQHLANGSSTDEIAEKCHLSPKTINNYRSSLLTKTNTRNTIELVIFALKNNIIRI